MDMVACGLWWIVLGALVGCVASWLLGRSVPVRGASASPLDAPVPQTVDAFADNPAHLERIAALEREVALIPDLRGQIRQLKATPPRIVERVVETVVERPVERLVDPSATEARVQEIASLRARVEELERGPAVDPVAALAAGFSVKGADDLEVIEGIGPKIADVLRTSGIGTFTALARTTPHELRDVLDKAGPSFRMANPDTWPEQSSLAARNHWMALRTLQATLTAGNR